MNSRSVSSPTIRSNVRASELVAAATFFPAARCRVRCADSARPHEPAPRRRGCYGPGGGATPPVTTPAPGRGSRRQNSRRDDATERRAERRPIAAPKPDRDGPLAGDVRHAWAMTSTPAARWPRVVGRRNPARPTVFGEHQRPRVVAVARRFQHHRQAAVPAIGDRDDVPAAQSGQRLVGRLAPMQPRRPGLRAFHLGNPCAHPGVFQDRRVGPTEFGGDFVLHPLAAVDAFTNPTTDRSAWYCANDCSKSWCACSGPMCWTRLIVMLYDGANELFSGNVRVDASPATADGSEVSSAGCQSTTAWPSTSIPRRPARPVNCVYSPASAARAPRR